MSQRYTGPETCSLSSNIQTAQIYINGRHVSGIRFKFKVNVQRLEDTQVEYASDKKVWNQNTLTSNEKRRTEIDHLT